MVSWVRLLPIYSIIAVLGFMPVVPLTHLTPFLDGSILKGFWDGVALIRPMGSTTLSARIVPSLRDIVLKAIGRSISLSQSLQD